MAPGRLCKPLLLLISAVLSACTSASPRLSQEAVAPAETPLLLGDLVPSSVDHIVVVKSERRMVLLGRGQVLREYQVALGRNPIGHKQREGDGRTPEGLYFIDYRKPDSRFHRALRISYPAPHDVERARSLGVSPGGAIMIHGLPRGKGWIGEAHRGRDWTEGCIAVTNEEIEEIWRAVPVGTPVEIRT